MAQGVRGPVQAGRLSVPDPDHTVDPGIGMVCCKLRSLHGGRREFLVGPWPEDYVQLLEQLPRALQLEVQPAQREPS